MISSSSLIHLLLLVACFSFWADCSLVPDGDDSTGPKGFMEFLTNHFSPDDDNSMGSLFSDILDKRSLKDLAELLELFKGSLSTKSGSFGHTVEQMAKRSLEELGESTKSLLNMIKGPLDSTATMFDINVEEIDPRVYGDPITIMKGLVEFLPTAIPSGSDQTGKRSFDGILDILKAPLKSVAKAIGETADKIDKRSLGEPAPIDTELLYALKDSMKSAASAIDSVAEIIEKRSLKDPGTVAKELLEVLRSPISAMEGIADDVTKRCIESLVAILTDILNGSFLSDSAAGFGPTHGAIPKRSAGDLDANRIDKRSAEAEVDHHHSKRQILEVTLAGHHLFLNLVILPMMLHLLVALPILLPLIILLITIAIFVLPGPVA